MSNTFEADLLGQIYKSTDGNGYTSTMISDGFGRMILEKENGIKLSTTSYANLLNLSSVDPDPIVPGYVKLQTYEESGIIESENRFILNGSGDNLQNWLGDETGSGYFVSSEFYSVSGNLLATTHIERRNSFAASSNYQSEFSLDSNTKIASLAYYDALGAPREIYSDYRLNKATGKASPLLIKMDSASSIWATGIDNTYHKLNLDHLMRVSSKEIGQFRGPSTTIANYAYGDFGLNLYTDAQGNEHRYSYDAGGRLRETSFPYYKIDYTNEGYLSKITNKEGDYSEYFYDSNGFLDYSHVSDPDGTGFYRVYDYSYYSASASGKKYYLRSVTDGHNGNTVFDYDTSKGGLLSSITRNFDSFYYNQPVTFSFSYNDQFELENTTYPSGTVVHEDYSHGWPRSKTVDIPGYPSSITNYTYSNSGFVLNWDNPQLQLNQSTTLNNLLEIEQFSSNFRNNTYLQNFTYKNDGMVDLETKQLIDSSQTVVTETKDYEYDHLGQVKEVKDDQGAVIESYTYKNLNQPDVFTGNGKTYTFSTYGDYNQLQTFSDSTGKNHTFEYDDQGRVDSWLTSGTLTQNRHYLYDGFDRLSTITLTNNSTVINYDRDHSGEHFAKVIRLTSGVAKINLSFGPWSYQNDTDQIMESYTSNEVMIENRSTQSKEPSIILNDYQGHMIRAYDLLGNTIHSQSIGTWGTLLNYSENLYSFNRGFHGTDTLADAELNDMNQRHLVSEIGHWLQPEPYLSDPSAVLDSPLTYAPYRYAANNPINYSDPSGFSAAAVGVNPATGLRFVSGRWVREGLDRGAARFAIVVDGPLNCPISFELTLIK